MKIYKAEKSLAKVIEKNTSIAYCSPIEKADTDKNEATYSHDKLNQLLGLESKASIRDEDLYFHKSILVSTTWNKNDDVFTPKQVWAARHTPEDKPNNLDHNDSVIVGHMVSNTAIDKDGEIITDNTVEEDLPEKFHILTGEVIYRLFQDEECQERADKLIGQIESGEKFVSMECRFDDFDYALKPDVDGDSEGSIKIVARDEDTAFLTKHLRSYGGDGKYKDYKVGRVIKNLYFSGKGYVDKPANPESIIFTKDDFGLSTLTKTSYIDKSDVFCEGGVLYCSGQVVNNPRTENSMSDLDNGNDAKVASLQAKIDELTEKLAKADVSKYESKISDLEAQNEQFSSDTASAEAKVVDVTGQLKASEESCDTLTQEKVELETELQKVKAEKVRASRISSLVDGGVSKEIATEKVELFVNLNDDQFADLSSELIKSYAKQEDVEAGEVEEIDETEAEATEVIEATEEVDLDEVNKPSEPALAISAEEDDSDLRAELLSLASEFSSKKKESK